MSGYIIANYTITDPEKYAEYQPAVGPSLAQYGGKLIVASTEAKVIEGNPHSTTVVVEFESVEAAQRAYDSPEYTKIKHLRTSSTEGWLIIVPQFVMPQG